MQRYGAVIRLKPGTEEKYKDYHAHSSPGINDLIRQCNRNYSIFLNGGGLFGYYEYHGSHHQADMAKMAADPKRRSGGRSWSQCSSRSSRANGANAAAA